jgi:predicted amidohydrolase YtcJ
MLLDFGRANSEKVDLMGGYAYPGLADSHIHLSGVGQKMRMLDLSLCRSKEEMLNAIKKRVQEAKEDEWILGLGLDEHRLGGEVPDLKELDEISAGHPLFLTRVCFHAHLVNTAAYRLAKIGEDQPDPEGGAFGRDESGRLNGWVYENAAQAFYAARPKPNLSEKKDTIRQAVKAALASGLTAVHTEDLRFFGSVAELIEVYRELIEEGLYLRTHQLIYHPYLDELDESGLKAGAGDEWFRIGAMKIFADGSIGGGTARLSEPYADDPGNMGLLIHEDEELNELARQAVKRNMPIAVHAIGDEAADRVIGVMERHPLSVRSERRLRHRLIHGQFLRKDLIERLAKLEVVVDIQPRFVASDFPWVLERVGMKRALYAYAWKSLLDAGVRLAGGSDAPIEPLHPLLGIHAAVTRRRLEEPSDHPGYFPAQKLTPSQALQLFAVGSAMAAGEERERGTLAVGKYADMTVVDRDLLTVNPDELLQTQTVYTISNGKIAYAAP